MIESWKQSVLVAVVAIAALFIAAGLQSWSLEHSPTPEVTGIVLSYSGTTVVLKNGTRFDVSPRARVVHRLAPLTASNLRVRDLVVVVGRPGIDTLLATSVSLLPGRLVGGITEGWTRTSNGDVLAVGSIDTLWVGGFRLTTPDGGGLVEFWTDIRFSRLEGSTVADLQPGMVITASLSNGVAGFIQVLSDTR